MSAVASFARQNNALAATQAAMRRTNPVKEWPLSGGAQERRPFTILWSSGATSIEVCAGPARRLVAGTEIILSMGIDGPSTSKDPANVLTLSGVTATTHIILALDNALVPTTLTASATGSGTYPTDTGYTKRCIGLVECAAGVITNVIQYEDGAWLDPWMTPDTTSMNFLNGLLQQTGWGDTAANADPAETVELQWRAAMGGAAGYSTLINILKKISSWTGVDLSGATGDWPTAFSHHDLDGLNDAADDADHEWAMCNAYNIASYADDYNRNYCDSFGDRAKDKVISCTDRQLLSGGKTYLDWDLCQLSDGTYQAIDWYYRTMHGDWYQYDTASHFYVRGTEAITPGTAATGGLQVAGGASIAGSLQAAALYLIGAATTNYWTTTALRVANEGENIINGDSVEIRHGPEASASIKVSHELIELYPSTGGALQVFGQAVTLIDCNLDIDGTPTPAKVLACLV
jgi:hypothetical protein